MAEFKAAILLPKSSLYPALAIDLVAGLKAGLKELNSGIQLIFENIGFGEDHTAIYAKTEKLLLQDDVNVVVAFMDHSEGFKLSPLFASMNRLLIILDPGAHIPSIGESSPYCLTLSLQAAFGSRLTGKLAAQEGSLKPVFATSFYEGGYLQCFSYQRGIESGGAQIQSHLIVPYQRENFDISPLHTILKNQQPDSILAQFSAESGEYFLKEYVNSGLQNQLKLYSSPFMLEEMWLSTIQYPFNGIRGYVTWLRNLPSNTNQLFLQKIKEQTGKDGNIFSMFGWETAQFITACKQILDKHRSSIIEAQHELENINIVSPRGQLKIHIPTHHLLAPMYLAEIIATENNFSKLKLIEENMSISYEFDKYVEEQPEGIFSKWTNTYLCI